MEAQISKLKIYSLGTVASNKPRNSNVIEVLPIEVNPMVDGEITDNATTQQSKGLSDNKTPYQTETTTTSTIQATWLPLGQANRQTSPDVRRGEEVVIYQFADHDEFFWNTKLNDLAMRKLETVVYGFSGTAVEGAKVEESNTYLLEISTHKGLVRLHTSEANGEFTGYDVTINAKDGFVKIADTDGNYFLLDSRAKQLRMENVSGSFLDITDQVATLHTGESINLTTKAFSLKADTISMEASNTTIKSETSHQGNIAVQGNISGSAGAGGDGSGTFQGGMRLEKGLEVGQDAKVGGVMHATKVISDQPIDAPNV